jgi:alkylation response protein AidB-like acyl-CoA dehydrogenase
VIGGPGDGAKVALSVLADERGANGLSLALLNRLEVERLALLADGMRRTGEATRERLGRLAMRVELQRALALKLLAWTASGTEIGPLSSIVKLRGAEHRQEIHELALEITGTGINELTGEAGIEIFRPQPLGTDPFATRVWAEDYLNARAGTIYGGSSQIQKSTIGEQLLGLPREPRISSTQ